VGTEWGWGWVEDVPPNPQNTAETVCVLVGAGRPVPNAGGVINLLRSSEVEAPGGESWHFGTTMDLAWTARALRSCCAPAEAEALVRPPVERLRADLDPAGGWGFTPGEEIRWLPTSLAMIALSEADDRIGELVATAAFQAAWDAIVATARGQGDGEPCPLSSLAYALDVLVCPGLAPLRSARSRRAVDRAVGSLLDAMAGDLPVEQEPFRRRDRLDVWRHLTVPLTVGAVARARPDAVLDPRFRRQFAVLCRLQERDPDYEDVGGYRVAFGGLITTYATVQSLDATLSVRASLSECLTGADVLDLAVREHGLHHSEGRDLELLPGRPLIVNSGAALAMAILATTMLAAGATAALAQPGGRVRNLLVWVMIALATVAWTAYLARWRSWSRAKVLWFLGTIATVVLVPAMLPALT